MINKIKDNATSPIEVNLNDHIKCSLAQDTKCFIHMNRKWDLEKYTPYRFLNANKVKVAVCHNTNIKMDFMDIYKSPRNALLDAVGCMTALNQKCRDKAYPFHVGKQIYNLKYQFAKLLYQDNKCYRVIRQINMNDTSTDLIWFFFNIEGYSYDYHIPENEVPFKFQISESKYIPNIESTHYNKNVDCMPFVIKRGLIKWVISRWNG